MDDFPATEEERDTVALVRALGETGNLGPLVDVLRGGDGGPERARDALHVLEELDPRLLIQITLDTLIDDYIDDPLTAIQTRRAVFGDGHLDRPGP